MNTAEIHKVLSVSIPDSFVGVFALNKIPKIVRYPAALVVNTAPWPEPGTHWVALLFLNPQQAEYFCSYGRPPSLFAFKRILRDYDCTFNQKRLQGNFSSVCGQYCIYYLVKRSQGLSMSQITQQFSENYEENDELVKCYINDTFDLDTMQYDTNYLAQQICTALLFK